MAKARTRAARRTVDSAELVVFVREWKPDGTPYYVHQVAVGGGVFKGKSATGSLCSAMGRAVIEIQDCLDGTTPSVVDHRGLRIFGKSAKKSAKITKKRR